MIHQQENLVEEFVNEQKIQEGQYSFPYHYLDQCIEFYRRVLYLDYLSLLRILREVLQPLRGQKLLDAGCGDGRLCYELRKDNVKVLGIDCSERAIRFAKAFNPSAEFRITDLTELNFDEEFDIVTMVEVLEHLSPSVIPITIRNLWRALKTQGKLLVSVPTTNLPLSPKHYQHFTVDGLEDLFTPMFETERRIGHLKSGRSWKHFLRLQRYAELVWPLRNKLGVKQFLKHVENYYRQNLESCRLKEAGRVILLFRKKPDC